MNLVEIVLVLYIINENVTFFLLFSEEKKYVFSIWKVNMCKDVTEMPGAHGNIFY